MFAVAAGDQQGEMLEYSLDVTPGMRNEHYSW